MQRFSNILSISFKTRFILFRIVSVFIPPSHWRKLSLKFYITFIIYMIINLYYLIIQVLKLNRKEFLYQKMSRGTNLIQSTWFRRSSIFSTGWSALCRSSAELSPRIDKNLKDFMIKSVSKSLLLNKMLDLINTQRGLFCDINSHPEN